MSGEMVYIIVARFFGPKNNNLCSRGGIWKI